MFEVVTGILATILNIALKSVIPLGIVGILAIFGFRAFKYAQTLQVTGEANQWVVVMRNGQMKQAGVGLSTWTSPGDTVAIFPSKVNKVNFATQQVTKEMSGLEVSAMICWVVNRQGDGPMKAYVSLGKQLEQAEPRTANELISKMASSVIRSQISNSTTDEILKNRDKLREAIKSEISKVTTGWGVWLETIEITDARIMSKSLFNDLQCTFLEDNNKKASLLKMEVDNQLTLERATHKLAEDKRKKDKYLEDMKRQYDNAYKQKLGQVQSEELAYKIRKQETDQRKKDALYAKQVKVRQEIKNYQLKLDESRQNTKNSMIQKQQHEENLKQELEFAKKNEEIQIEKVDREDEAERAQLQSQYGFRKEQLAQPGFLDKKRAEVIASIYQRLKSEGHDVSCTGKDPIAQLVDGFTHTSAAGFSR